MTSIKSEPQSDTPLTFSNVQNDLGVHSRDISGKAANATSDSRPALGSKKVNVAIGKKEPSKELKKHIFEEFLLSPGRVGTVTPGSHSSKEKPLVKQEPEYSKGLVHEGTETPIKRQTNVIEAANSSKKKKLNTAEKFKKVIPANDIMDTTRQQFENPGLYSPIRKLLYESNEDYGEASDQHLFQDLEHESERNFCQEASRWPMVQWIEQGQVLLKEHTNLIGQLVQQRIELSHKFQAITTIINERAEALNNQGEILDEKMTKIENLGKEILDII